MVYETIETEMDKIEQPLTLQNVPPEKYTLSGFVLIKNGFYPLQTWWISSHFSEDRAREAAQLTASACLHAEESLRQNSSYQIRELYLGREIAPATVVFSSEQV